MPHHWDHWVPFIDLALPHAIARMGVDVSQNFEPQFAATGPERGAAAGVKRDPTALISVRIEIVVADVGCRHAALTPLSAEQERAAFATPATAAPQIEN